MRLLDSGQAPAAVRLIDSALAKAPGNSLLVAMKARALLAQGQKSQALALAARAERMAPRDPQTQHNLALFHAQSGDRRKAAELESSFALSPAADRAAAARASILNFETGRLPEAIALGERAVSLDDRVEVRLMLARAYEKSGNPDGVARHYDALLRADPYEEETYSSYGQALLRMGRFPQAVSVLEEGQKRFDKSAQIILALGVAYYGERRFSEAGGRFLRVIDIAPAVPQPYLFLSKMLNHVEARMPDAIARFEQWNRAETTSPFPPLVLGKALLLSGDQTRAEALFRDSIRRRDDVWESHFELGQVLDAAGDLSGAAREYQRAIALSPDQPPPHYKLARVYVRQGLTAKAELERRLHSRLVEQEKRKSALPEGIQ